MTDVLLYWRDYRKNAEHPIWCWDTNSRFLSKLKLGDRLWFVTSGSNLRMEPGNAAFLVAVWPVQEVIDNPGDNPSYPPERLRYRIIPDVGELLTFHDPVMVDQIVRPIGHNRKVPIGKLLRAPRGLNEEKVRLLRTASGPQMALQWLTGK